MILQTTWSPAMVTLDDFAEKVLLGILVAEHLVANVADDFASIDDVLVLQQD